MITNNVRQTPVEPRPSEHQRPDSAYSSQSSKLSFTYHFSSCEADDEESSDDDSIEPDEYRSGGNELPLYEGEVRKSTSKKEIIGWYIYNFAAEVFVTCGIGMSIMKNLLISSRRRLAGSYLPIILEQMARENGVLLSDKTTPCRSSSSRSSPGPHTHTLDPSDTCVIYVLGIPINTASFAMYTFSISVLFQATLVISISGAADHSNHRKRLLLIFAYSGAVTTMLFLFIIPELYYMAALLAILSNTFCGASFVLLNSFLPLIVRNHPKMLYQKPQSQTECQTLHSVTSPLLSQGSIEEPVPLKARTRGELELSSQISSSGLGAGYSAALFVQCASTAIVWFMGSSTFSLKVVLFLVGLWWAIFTIPAGYFLRSRPGPPYTSSNPRDSFHGFNWVFSICHAWLLLWRRIKLVRRLRDITIFLLAWFLLSDAIATVSGTAVLYAKTTLHMKPEALGLINIITISTGVIGAFSWSFISRVFGLKPNQVILICICLFEVIPLYGLSGFLPVVQSWGVVGLQQPWEMYPLCFVYGFVIGGLSSYCRSLFGELIPPGSEAAFFALYAITDKGSSVFGPAIVGAIVDRYGDIRPAFWFLAVLIGLPGPLFWFLDVKRGKNDGRKLAKVLAETSDLSRQPLAR